MRLQMMGIFRDAGLGCKACRPDEKRRANAVPALSGSMEREYGRRSGKRGRQQIASGILGLFGEVSQNYSSSFSQQSAVSTFCLWTYRFPSFPVFVYDYSMVSYLLFLTPAARSSASQGDVDFLPRKEWELDSANGTT